MPDTTQLVLDDQTATNIIYIVAAIIAVALAVCVLGAILEWLRNRHQRRGHVHAVTATATHCPYCLILTADAWGIPLEVAAAHAVGEPRYCHTHRKTILAKARLGA